MSNPLLLKVWLEFISSTLWPIVVLIIFLIFKKQIERLIERIKSGKVAGAEFNFSEAASAYISSRIEQVADEPDLTKRAKLAGEIKSIAGVLGAIHPISLSLLINSVTGNHAWINSAYTDRKKFFMALEKANLAKVIESTNKYGDLEARVEPTTKGQSVLRDIGFQQ